MYSLQDMATKNNRDRFTAHSVTSLNQPEHHPSTLHLKNLTVRLINDCFRRVYNAVRDGQSLTWINIKMAK